MKIVDQNILELPSGLSETQLYKLLELFDKAITEDYNIEFTREDEFSAIREAVDYFYKKTEVDSNGNPDEYAIDIDENYLTFLILSGKATRTFVDVLLNGDFNIGTAGSAFIEVDSNNIYGYVINFDIIEAENSKDAIGKLNNMFNHLLYYHELLIKVAEFTQLISVLVEKLTIFKSIKYNAVFYERYE